MAPMQTHRLVIAGLGGAALLVAAYFALSPRDTTPRSPSAALRPDLPPPPRAAPQASAPTPDGAAGSASPTTPSDPEATRVAADAVLWEATSSTVDRLSNSGGWTTDETDQVMEALRWRHDQIIAFRKGLQDGTVDAVEGRRAIVETANTARATVIHAVGTERARALDLALAESDAGAGL